MRPDRSDVVTIARCPEHGLHGERTECFVCGGPVEQVPMVPEAELERAWRNGWGSALNMLRAADKLVSDHSAMDDPSGGAIIAMVRQWVALIDGLTDSVVEECRAIGLASPPENGGRSS